MQMPMSNEYETYVDFVGDRDGYWFDRVLDAYM